MTMNALANIPTRKSENVWKHLPNLNRRERAALVLGLSIYLQNNVLHNPLVAWLLALAFVGACFSKQLNRILKVKPWQMFTAIATTALLVTLGMHSADAQTAPGGSGLFNPLQQRTNQVLTAAGASGAANSVAGIFSLMTIIVTIAGIGSVVYGAYQQQQGHTLRESFTPLALVLVVYIGCSFVMALFLGAT